jgi:DNA (cytosine-5)-methyltransferase 1
MAENPHRWVLADLDRVPPNGLRVFSTFSCGGGSSMGYKLAGFTMTGANDIDPAMREHYERNLHPPLYVEAPIRDLLTMDLPDALLDLDILDGSPPCSTFSTSGNRDKDWGREKFFREGQAAQVLDDLFFDFLDVAERLEPRVIVAENVKGLIVGKARGYVRMICDRLVEMGYVPQVFLVNAAFCGVPQRRERVFVAAIRRDLFRRPLSIRPAGSPIPLSKAFSDLRIPEADKSYITPGTNAVRWWHQTRPGRSFKDAVEAAEGRSSLWDLRKVHPDQPAWTLTSGGLVYHWDEPRSLTTPEFIRIGSFPDDYWFATPAMAKYLIGMSVPPRMMQVVASAIRDQWLQPEDHDDDAA